MTTFVTKTSIDSYYEHQAAGRACAQRERILLFIRREGGDWSIGELAHELHLDKSAVSARVFELLHETEELAAMPKRKDRISGVTVRPVGIPFAMRPVAGGEGEQPF